MGVRDAWAPQDNEGREQAAESAQDRLAQEISSRKLNRRRELRPSLAGDRDSGLDPLVSWPVQDTPAQAARREDVRQRAVRIRSRPRPKEGRSAHRATNL